jgi:hypothetical protein
MKMQKVTMSTDLNIIYDCNRYLYKLTTFKTE